MSQEWATARGLVNDGFSNRHLERMALMTLEEKIDLILLKVEGPGVAEAYEERFEQIEQRVEGGS